MTSKRMAEMTSTADLLLDAGAIEQARSLIARIERNELTAGILDYFTARLDITEEKWVAALEMLKQAQGGLQRLPPLLTHSHLLKQPPRPAAECHARLGKPELQDADCRAALQVDPAWQPAFVSRAQAAEALGRYEEAASLYARGWPQARLEAARL